jgi:predicted nucleotidyltransferase
MTTAPIALEEVEPVLAELGRRHTAISKLEVFGSVAVGSACAESDLDVLVTFGSEVPRDIRYVSLFSSLVEELQSVFGRRVDLVDRQALRNDLFGYNVVQNLKTVYERL